MEAQLSLEILIGMAVSLLVAVALAGYLSGAAQLIDGTRGALSAIANSLA
jgi:hypothetical protein